MPNPYEIAARRFEQIAFLIDPSLDAAQRRVAWRKRSGDAGRSTLFRWLKAYREHGYMGLLPKPRSDRGKTRKAGTTAWVGYAIGLLYEQPERSLTQLDVYLRAEFADYSLGKSTLRRDQLAATRHGTCNRNRPVTPPGLRRNTSHRPRVPSAQAPRARPGVRPHVRRAHVFYPEATPARCTAALLLDVDPIALVRGRRGGGKEASGPLGQCVNDRPYVASSFSSVAIARVYGSALSGTCNHRPELVSEALPLEARLAVVPARGGEAVLHRLFEPLGYHVDAARHDLDAEHEEWGVSPYYTVTLTKTTTLRLVAVKAKLASLVAFGKP